jgi:hypothetical protein
MTRTIRSRSIPCPIAACKRTFSNCAGLSNHLRTHRTPQARLDPAYHNHIDDNDIQVNDFAPHGPHPDEDLEDRPRLNDHSREKTVYHPYINGYNVHFNSEY